MQNKLLLHICCGCCAGAVIEKLREKGFDVVAFFYNPNIYPKEEYIKRKEAVMTILEKYSVGYFEGFVDEIYDEENEKWIFNMSELKLDKEPESGKRCNVCFEERLRKTAEAAETLGISYFASTLTVSPHKNAGVINSIGEKIAAENGLKFVSEDFKRENGFQKAMSIARGCGIYRQNYCGCRFSIRN